MINMKKTLVIFLISIICLNLNINAIFAADDDAVCCVATCINPGIGGCQTSLPHYISERGCSEKNAQWQIQYKNYFQQCDSGNFNSSLDGGSYADCNSVSRSCTVGAGAGDPTCEWWPISVNANCSDRGWTYFKDDTRCVGLPPPAEPSNCCCTYDPPPPPILLPPSPPAASGQVTLKSVYLTNPIGDSIPAIIGSIIKAFLRIVGAIALLVFIYGGFRWLTAAGNDQSIAAGRDTLLWAAIGLILIFLSYILVGYVMQALGVI